MVLLAILGAVGEALTRSGSAMTATLLRIPSAGGGDVESGSRHSYFLDIFRENAQFYSTTSQANPQKRAVHQGAPPIEARPLKIG